jgi:hypothetical protein
MVLSLIWLLGYNVFALIGAFSRKPFLRTQILFFSLCIINAVVLFELPVFIQPQLDDIISDSHWVGYALIITVFVITLLNVASYFPLKDKTKNENR